MVGVEVGRLNATYRRNIFLSRDPSTKHRKADVKKINEYIIEIILERMADSVQDRRLSVEDAGHVTAQGFRRSEQYRDVQHELQIAVRAH